MIQGVTRPESFEGSQPELYLQLPDVGESQLVHRVVAAGAPILELGCGTGRITRGLLEMRHPVTAVDNDQEMLSHVPKTAEVVLSDIETLKLETSFPVVLLASNLINNPHQSVRSKLLATCRSHVSEEGVLILQRYQPDLEGWEPGDWMDRGPVVVRISRFERQGDPRITVASCYRSHELLTREGFRCCCQGERVVDRMGDLWATVSSARRAAVSGGPLWPCPPRDLCAASRHP